MEEHTHFFNLVAEEENRHTLSEEKKLELRLGPPGEFLGLYNNITSNDDQDRFEGTWLSNTHEMQCNKLSWPSSSYLHSSAFQREANNKEIQEHVQPKGSSSSSYLQCSRVVELQCQDKKKPCCGHAPAPTRDGTSCSHKRVAAAAVVGWPPIRSFRKNLASNGNSKPASDLPNKTPAEGCTVVPESFRNDLFVKINMEGIPIGRKINLNAYDSYEKLSIAIDELFRGLLAAQRESTSAVININNIDEAKSASGVGVGEYTLVYEDSEGDRILVGDVPWHMFVSTAKRLRVLKSSQLSTSPQSLGSRDQDNLDKTPLNSLVETGRR